jgi:peptide/nickel transport system permease protein
VSTARRFTLTAWIGIGLAALFAGVAFLGPLFAPFDPDQIVGSPYAPPSGEYPLGLDFLGRDALSRFLWGGRTALLVALAGTGLGYALGLAIGLFAAYLRGWVDEVTMRATDVALAFPALVVVLLLVAAFGTDLNLVIAAIAIANAPRIARIARAAALEVVDLPYVEAAKARGERVPYILAREIMPNIKAPLLVDLGLRFTWSVLLVSAVSFVGLGLQPPAADWGLMVGENRLGLTLQPWPVLAPVIALGLLTIGINLAIDGYSRRAGHSLEREQRIARVT